MDRGKFITIEGIEGVGKSTNMTVLVERIRAAGHKVLTTREPGGTPMAEDIREILVRPSDEPIPEIAELLLIFAARSLNVNNVIIPALDAGSWVISDRFTDSSRAYQGGGRGIPMETIEVLADWVHGDAWPDLTILLDANGLLVLRYRYPAQIRMLRWFRRMRRQSRLRENLKPLTRYPHGRRALAHSDRAGQQHRVRQTLVRDAVPPGFRKFLMPTNIHKTICYRP